MPDIKTYGAKDMTIFDGRPKWHKPFMTSIEYPLKEVGLSSSDCHSTRAEKIYVLEMIKIKFVKDTQTTWAKGMLDSVSEFVSRNSVLENRVKILEVSYPNRDNYGELLVECYMHKHNEKTTAR